MVFFLLLPVRGALKKRSFRPHSGWCMALLALATLLDGSEMHGLDPFIDHQDGEFLALHTLYVPPGRVHLRPWVHWVH